MKTMAIMNSAGKAINKVGFRLKKHSPEILIVLGVVGTVTSAVMACKATTKIGDILDKTKEFVGVIHENIGNEALAEEYTQEDAKKDLTIVYVQTCIKLVRLYAPAVLLGAVSITSILASNRILRKRSVALAAAYATIDKGFKEYRNRVLERFGSDVDRELKHGIKAKKFEEVTVDENGKEKKTGTTVNVSNVDGQSGYARYFDEHSRDWQSDWDYNLMFLRSQQTYANDLLKARGYLYLNEVYDMLGIPISKAGQIVGWVYNVANPVGDNYVDFGIYDTNREVDNGYEKGFLLDFNVDGNIWDLM